MKILHVQTLLTEEEIKKLIKVAKTTCKKDALRKAVLFYIEHGSCIKHGGCSDGRNKG